MRGPGDPHPGLPRRRPVPGGSAPAAPRPFRGLLPFALLLLLSAPPPAAGEGAPPPPAVPERPPSSPATGAEPSSPPGASAPAPGGAVLSPEGLRGRLSGRHKREVRELFAPPDRMTDLHRDGDRVHGDGAEVTNLFASGQWVWRGEKAARVVDPATGRKGAEIRVWFDLNDRTDLVEIDWAE